MNFKEFTQLTDEEKWKIVIQLDKELSTFKMRYAENYPFTEKDLKDFICCILGRNTLFDYELTVIRENFKYAVINNFCWQRSNTAITVDGLANYIIKKYNLGKIIIEDNGK